MSAIARWPLTLSLLVLPVLLTAGVAAALAPVVIECGPGSSPPKPVCQCGDTVVGAYVFPADLTCGDDPGEPVNGLFVGSGASVDLNGFELSGTDKQGLGLVLTGIGGFVDGGRIRNFDTGIRAFTTIAGWNIGTNSPLSVASNREGIRLVANDTTITDTGATSNASNGVVLIGGANEVTRITCSKNGGTGLLVEGNENLIDHNRCERNAEEGLHVRGDGNTLIRNLGGGNGGDGVHVSGLAGNVLESNQGRNNAGDGVRGVGDGFTTNGRNYGAGNGGVECLIDGFTPTGGGRYC